MSRFNRYIIKYTACLLAVITMLFLPKSTCAAQEPDSLSAQSAIIIDSATGTVLFEKNADEIRSMASTTKIMTTLLALESGRKAEELTVPKQAVLVEGSSMGLKAGDKITLYDLCVGMMLSSGNEAANAVALYLGGTYEDFAEMMNEKAAEIGLENTSFVTPSGLDDENHYSTARDMALLAAYAMKNYDFTRLAKSENMRVSFGNPKQEYTLYNHNKLLDMYEGACGIKTGFTKKSGRCLVSAVERDGAMLIAVTLSAPDDWNDHIKMYDYGFSQMVNTPLDSSLDIKSVTVKGGVEPSVEIVAEQAEVLLPFGKTKSVEKEIVLNQTITAPIEKGDILGSIIYTVSGTQIATSSVFAAEDVPEKEQPVNEDSVFIIFLKNLLKIFAC